MNKFFIQKSIPNTRYIHLLSTGPEAGSEQVQSRASVNTQTPAQFIDRHNQEIDHRLNKIPVDPKIKDLCHDRISALITEASSPEYQTDQARLETEIVQTLNHGEGESFAATENKPALRQSKEEVEANRVATEQAMATYLKQVSLALKTQAQDAKKEAEASKDEQKLNYAQNLNKRGDLINTVGQSIEQNGVDWSNEVPFGGGSEALLSQAESTVGTQEGSEADALVGIDTASIPWCGAFVKSMCEQSGQPLPEGPNWNVAETYVSPEGSTGEHVAIYAGNGEMVGGNQSNAVTKTALPGSFRFNTVENILAGNLTDLSSQQEPQPGDIIVTSRGDGNSDKAPNTQTA